MNTYATDAAIALTVLAILATSCVRAWIQNFRARRAARESAKRDRLHTIATTGMRSAFMRGWIDERGNVIERVGLPFEDVQ